MKNFLYNTGYFIKETMTIIRLNLISNIFSVLSIGLVFFILALIASSWWIGSEVIDTVQGEAEIDVYYNSESLTGEELAGRINEIEGVQGARFVNEKEAYERMVEILGKETRIMEYFDDNPFSPFVEVKINLDDIDNILEAVRRIPDVEHVRDNRAVLDRLYSIVGIMRYLGYLLITAVGVSTIIVISHIIRQGIYNNREQINTLRLLGAPEAFIAFPFILEGLVLTVGGGLLAAGMSMVVVTRVYALMSGPLPFIPLPSLSIFLPNMVLIVIVMSCILGICGSIYGILSAKGR
ncbi:MAG: cell division protein FtsX [Bacillota bacterium]